MAGFSLEFWAGVFGPANLPVPVRDKLATLSSEVLDDPELKAALEKHAFVVRNLTGHDFAAFIREDFENAKQIIEEGKISLPK